MRSIPDPYRVLGIRPEATLGEIKAAHRSLAKRYHPDALEADTARFLSVQEAYLTLSDPLRRREWDAGHRPGPVRADGGTGGPRTSAAGRGTSSGRGTPAGRATPSGRSTSRGRGTAQDSGAAQGSADAPGSGGAGGGGAAGGRPQAAGSGSRRRRRPEPWSTSGRDPYADSYTWSARNVPWWEEGVPSPGRRPPGRKRPRAAEDVRPTDAAGTPPAGRAGTHPTSPLGAPPTGTSGSAPTGTAGSPGEFDVYNRSSGAAWSMASRAYFRRAAADLPRGAAEPFGHRWTSASRPPDGAASPPMGSASTGARASAGMPASARATASAGVPTSARATASAGPPAAAGAAAFTPASASAAAMPRAGVTYASDPFATLHTEAGAASRWPRVRDRVLYATLAWLPPLVFLAGPPGALLSWRTVLLAGLLAIFAVAPRLAYVAAVGGAAALVATMGLLLGLALVGPPAPEPLGTLGPLLIGAVYLGGALLAMRDWPTPRPWTRE